MSQHPDLFKEGTHSTNRSNISHSKERDMKEREEEQSDSYMITRDSRFNSFPTGLSRIEKSGFDASPKVECGAEGAKEKSLVG